MTAATRTKVCMGATAAPAAGSSSKGMRERCRAMRNTIPAPSNSAMNGEPQISKVFASSGGLKRTKSP